MTGEFWYIRAIEPPTKIYYLCVSIKGFLDPLGIAFGGASSKGSFILRPSAFQGRVPVERSRADQRRSALLNVGEGVLRTCTRQRPKLNYTDSSCTAMVRQSGPLPLGG